MSHITLSTDLLYQVGLTLVPNIGAVHAKTLLDHFGDAESIFKAKLKDLGRLDGIGDVRAGNIKSFNNFSRAEDEIRFIEKYKIHPLFIRSENYPRRLQKCYDAPLLLYYRGNADINNNKVLAIVGTRTNTDYGRQVTEQLVHDLASLNVLVVSGLAFGIDAIAHKVAIKQQLPTIGVVGHGLDRIYPADHTALAKEMLQQGGILTEFRSQTKPDKHHFPLRNRLVAGISDATVVVETGIKGGSLITAEMAELYKRDVFAVPGRTIDPKSAGCNYLIKTRKAEPLFDSAQLLEQLGWQTKKTRAKPQGELFVNLSDDETILVDILKEKEITHIDELFLKSSLTSSAVAAAMLSLEFQNVVTSLPGKQYRLS
ncbi:DNA-protecting protein DprA [Segetibacter sp. 3557_3]|uniref:DNA-processing protein DprA n=1 Tax=Segetibacter sp. 3557_3 TaxID=2547429 RepID=UPI00105919B2|nr:DNA-processing protein DprA [Segetibacter sp. 3557_3]TDH21301.1 DNA-protecting protein DprA [Segetibacter sp. 3557_3]